MKGRVGVESLAVRRYRVAGVALAPPGQVLGISSRLRQLFN